MGEIKLKNLFVMISLLLIITMNLHGQQTSLPNQSDPNFKAGTNINVPNGDCQLIITDGKFNDGEWKDAIELLLSDDYHIYLKADDQVLAVGLKFPKPMGELVCEIRITADDKEVFLLHSSGGMGEGVSGFPATTKFDLKSNKLWESNFSTKNPEKEAEWIAAGEPIERYDEVYHKRDGIEFKISRKKIASDTLKFIIGWIRVEIKDRKPDYKRYNYPAEAGLSNSGNWAKLILPVTIDNHGRQSDFPKLAGPYFSQKLPGIIPEIFAPGIISTGLYTRDITISKDGGEIYFCVSDRGVSAIFVSTLTANGWTEPVIAPFSGKGFRDFEPHISPDGQKFFFLSNRPPHDKPPRTDWYYQNIWMMTKLQTGWSEPQLVPEPVSTDENEFFPSVTYNNTLYFTRSTKNGNARLYRSKFENGHYSEPEILPFNIPEKGSLFNAFISPQEDFLITCALNIDSANIDQDYYISYRMKNGAWSELIRFGPEINTPGDNANSAYFSPDGKYLFFSSSRKAPSAIEMKSGTSLKAIINSKAKPGNGSSAIYWVSAKIIEELRPKK
ncbi:PD40 domain-containing protein [candidate division KSB1 bacterium]|nr:PD40 domain-containing protein [candidate division KSB1 bacterium]